MYCSKPGLYMTDSVLSTTVLLLKVGSTVISIPYIREPQQREVEVEELGWDANMGSLPRICVLTPTDDYLPMIKEIIQRSDLKRQAQNDTDSKKTRRDSNSHLPDWTDPICHPAPPSAKGDACPRLQQRSMITDLFREENSLFFFFFFFYSYVSLEPEGRN